MNRSLLILLSVIGAFLASCSSFVTAQVSTGPLMVIKEPLRDFKEVKEGVVLRHDFKVLNQGDETLIIEKVRPG